MDSSLSSQRKIRKILRVQLNQAELEFAAANGRFSRLAQESARTVVIHPDKTLLLRDAENDSGVAVHRYMNALRRLSDFLIHGTVPDDLRPPA